MILIHIVAKDRSKIGSVNVEDLGLDEWEEIDVSKENPNWLLTSGSILTTDKAMASNQKI